MIRASVSYTKNNLSALLNQVKEGETIVVTDRDRPVARIVSIEKPDWSTRLRELESKGSVRFPEAPPLDPATFRPVEMEEGRVAGVLDALIEDRREGR